MTPPLFEDTAAKIEKEFGEDVPKDVEELADDMKDQFQQKEMFKKMADHYTKELDAEVKRKREARGAAVGGGSSDGGSAGASSKEQTKKKAGDKDELEGKESEEEGTTEKDDDEDETDPEKSDAQKKIDDEKEAEEKKWVRFTDYRFRVEGDKTSDSFFANPSCDGINYTIGFPHYPDEIFDLTVKRQNGLITNLYYDGEEVAKVVYDSENKVEYLDTGDAKIYSISVERWNPDNKKYDPDTCKEKFKTPEKLAAYRKQ